jgi:hypothetical protein
MANTQVTHSAGPNNARSESSVAINPKDPKQLVSASKKFHNILTYDFTLATEYSHDGGHTWMDSAALALPAGATVMTDPTLAWDDVGNVFLVGLTGNTPPTWNTIGIVIYKSSDAGVTWSAPNPIHNSPNDDKQWVAADGNAASPFHGNVYAVWDDVGGMDYARTTDAGTTWTGAGGAPAGAVLASGGYYPEVTVADDGTVYLVSIGGSQIGMIVSTDGGDTFAPAANPASGVTTLEASLPSVDGWPEFAPGASFRVITDPSVAAYGETVLVAWPDYRDGVARIYYARSRDRGATWKTGATGKPLLRRHVPANFQHFHPQMVVNPDGVFACAFYELGPKPTNMLIDVIVATSRDHGRSFRTHRVTDHPWNPALDAPWAHGDPKVTFIGDYFGLAGSERGFHPVWTDTRTGIQELWTDTLSAERHEDEDEEDQDED